ncbi:M12 family metallopeptidase [Glaciimonas sp. GG7]
MIDDIESHVFPQPPCVCTIKRLPQHLLIPAAAKAMQINLNNAPPRALQTEVASNATMHAEHMAALTKKYWGPKGTHLRVQFLDYASPALRKKILSNMNAWGQYANVLFTETAGKGQVRITFTPGGGYWSYLGTDILQIQQDQPTMNLESFSVYTSDAEFHRVVRHETGHTLGFPHEHTRSEIVSEIDREVAIKYFMKTQGWSRDDVIAQVLTPLDNSALLRTEQADTNSIMCYWLPAAIMKNRIAVDGGKDIDAQDAAFAALIYPKPAMSVAA